MLKKEFKEAGKVFSYYCGFSMALTVLAYLVIKLTFDQKLSLLDIVELFIHPAMLLLAFILGASLFAREKTEGAFEYLYSLPLSRGKVIACKILTRLFYLLVMLGIYTLLALNTPSLKPLFKFPVLVSLYFSVFLIAASLSLNRRKGAASVFQSLFHFTWISAAFFYFFYLAVYWQFTLKDQPRYFKSENVFSKIVLEQPYGLIASYFFLSLLLFAVFLFRFKRTDLKNQGALPIWKFIRFAPISILVFIFAFFIQEYCLHGTKSPVFKYELAGNLLLQSNGYDLFIHASDGRRHLNLDLSGQGCHLFFHQEPKGKKYFLWTGLDLYRLETGAYTVNKIYAISSRDELLFIKKSSGKLYIGEAGWSRTDKKQLIYKSKLVTIYLKTEKYLTHDVNLHEAKPIFLYTRDDNQGLCLSDILTYDNGFIRSLDLKTGKVVSTDMKLNLAIEAIKLKYPAFANYNLTQVQHVSRNRVMLGLKKSLNAPYIIFEIFDNGNISPWPQSKYFPWTEVDTYYLFTKISRDDVFLEASSITPKSLAPIFVSDFKEHGYAQFVARTRNESGYNNNEYNFNLPFCIIGSDQNSDIYFFHTKKDMSTTFFKIQGSDLIFIKEIPHSVSINDHQYILNSTSYLDFHYLQPDPNSFFTSGSGMVIKYGRSLDRNPILKLFRPWTKNYVVKVFAFHELKELDFGDIRLINE